MPAEGAAADRDAEPARLGRMYILTKLGEGAMGVVHAAYDPELARKVAVKRLHAALDGDAGSHARLLREAQALARLRHPNVVAVHDVGVDERGMWIAMEFVQGRTVAAWLAERARGWRDILDVFVQAARGVEAAHRAGLLHRDLKPTNLMLDDDGRVRVLDFGLVRHDPSDDEHAQGFVTAEHTPLASELTQPGSLLGTPAYMAPELLRGGVADPRSDQFSLCVALAEALFGCRPVFARSATSRTTPETPSPREPAPPRRKVPRWLQRVVARGLAQDPAARFPDVTALRRALESDPTRRRRIVGICVLAAVVALAWFVARQIQREHDNLACTAAGASIDDLWNDAARDDLRAGLLASGAAYADTTFARTTPWIDAYTAEWRTARVDVCHAATITATLPPESAGRAVTCLQDRRHHLETILEILASPGSGEPGRGFAENTIMAAAKLPSLAPCTDPAVLAREAPSSSAPDDTQEVRRIQELLGESAAYRRIGAYHDALARAQEARAAAEAQNIRSLQAAADVALGAAHERLGDYKTAEAQLESGYFAAGSLGDDDTQALAAELLIDVVGSRLERHREGREWGRAADTALDRLDIAADDLRRAQILSHLGIVRDKQGDAAAALALLDRALAIETRHLGPNHPDIAGTLVNIGLVRRRTGEDQEAAPVLERAVEIYERSLGVDHPQTAQSRGVLATIYASQGNYQYAIELLTQVLAVQEGALGPDHPSLASTLANLGKIHDMKGEYTAARANMLRAHAIRERVLGPDHMETANARVQLASVYLAQGELTSAHDLLQDALSSIERGQGKTHPAVASPLIILAMVQRKQGAFARAIESLERALAVEEAAFGPDHPTLVHAIHSLGLVYSQQGDDTRAAAALERVIAILDRAATPDKFVLATTLGNLGTIYRRIGDHARARAAFDRGRPIAASLDPDHPALASIHTNLGILHRIEGSFEEAIPLLRQALDMHERRMTDPLKIAEVNYALAQALWETAPKNRPEARARAERANAVYAASGPLYAKNLRQTERWLRTHRR